MNNIHPNIMYIFPGQGSQYVGMGSDIYTEFASAREVYQHASDILKFDVAKLSFHGPQSQLDRTEFTQPLLLTHSIACLEALKEQTSNQYPPAVVAGHSLGEYSALVAAEALTFEDALKLVQQRGRLMSEFGRGNMAAFRLDRDSLKTLAESHYCSIGGCNLPDQTVACGFKEDLDALIGDIISEYGKAKAGRFLNTEGAFHTYLMISAAEHFRPYLDSTTVHVPRVKVLSNYTGNYHFPEPARIKASLFFQIFHPVKWMWGLNRAIADGVNTIIEFGGGIGKDRPGEAQSPASRKPNLQGITQKTQKASGRDGLYLPAINSGSLQHTVNSLRILQNFVSIPQDTINTNGTWLDEKLYCLHIPVRNHITSQNALELSSQVQGMGLDSFVQTIGEPYDHNIEHLQSSCDANIMDAEPYLEVIIGGTTGAVLLYRGDEIVRELRELRRTLEHRGYVFAA